MSKRFQPHEYAKQFTQSRTHASDKQVLWKWTSTHWEPIDDTNGECDAYAWLVCHQPEYASPTNAKAAHQAAIMWAPGLPLRRTNALIVPTLNGYVHVVQNHIEFHRHDPQEGIQYLINCRYDPDAPAPMMFQRFLDRALPNPMVQSRVQEFSGYSISPGAEHQRGQLWRGPGANGKGVLANILQAIHARVAAIQLNALDGFKLASVIGASLIYCDEAPQRGVNEQTLKSLIAGESVQIDRKYRDPITTKITGKVLILANHAPAVTDHSVGFWRRFDIIPFDVIIPEREREPGLAEKIIAAELPGVLNWALAGLLRLLQRGHFDPVLPSEIIEAQATARRETNSVEAWFDDQAIGWITDVTTFKSHVYDYYSEWCKRNGMVALASPRFWNRLNDKPGLSTGRKRVAGRQTPVCNLRLPSDAWEAPGLGDDVSAQTVQSAMSYPVH